MTGKELAAALGISQGMVSRLIARGMPSDNIDRAKRWRKKHLQTGRLKGVRRVGGQIQDSETTAGAPGEPEHTSDDDDQDLDPEDLEIRRFVGARERREYYQAELAKMAMQREMGQLLVAKDVEQFIFTAATACRNALEGMPDRIAGQLGDHVSEEQLCALLRQEVHAVLTDLSAKFSQVAQQGRSEDNAQA